MSRSLAAVLFLIAALAVASLTTSSARQRERWEYSLQYTDSEGTLNKLGQEGWEVAAVYTTGEKGGVRVILKRRRG